MANDSVGNAFMIVCDCLKTNDKTCLSAILVITGFFADFLKMIANFSVTDVNIALLRVVYVTELRIKIT